MTCWRPCESAIGAIAASGGPAAIERAETPAREIARSLTIIWFLMVKPLEYEKQFLPRMVSRNNCHQRMGLRHRVDVGHRSYHRMHHIQTGIQVDLTVHVRMSRVAIPALMFIDWPYLPVSV